MPPQLSVKLKRRPADGKKTCPHCHCDFNVRGFGRHEQACRRIHQEEEPAPIVDAEDGTYPEPGRNGTPCVYLVINDPININPQISDEEPIQVPEITEDLCAEGESETGGSGEYGSEGTTGVFTHVNRVGCTDYECR